MELEQKVNSKPDKFSPESTLKIGNTKISLLKENSYMIESTGLLLDSINENMTHSHEHSHEHIKGQQRDKRVNMSLVSDVPSKSKITKKPRANATIKKNLIGLTESISIYGANATIESAAAEGAISLSRLPVLPDLSFTIYQPFQN